MINLKRIAAILILSMLVSDVMAQLTVTNLPIVIVTTPTPISNTKQQGTMNIINNASGTNNITDPPTFVGMIGVTLRGSSAYPKQSFTLETWSAPNTNMDTSLLGMPSENDWVLLSMYADRSLMRNVLSLHTHTNMGRYAPRMRYCELIVNNQYQGIYLLGETIKRDKNRLDLATLNIQDNFGDELTGGYIWKIDGNGQGWISQFAPPYGTTQEIKFEYHIPKSSDITPVQRSYIQSYVDSFETALNSPSFQDTSIGWRRFGAVNGFADFIIINEVTKNFEAYRTNTYMYKDKLKKMRPSPLWNFDLALRNTASCNSSRDTGWTYNIGGICPSETKLAPFWWSKLMTDTALVKDLKCLYTDYRKPGNILDTTRMFAFIDSVSNYLNIQGAIGRNFTQWPIWGVPIVNEPTPMAGTHTQEVDNMKQFIRARLMWLDTKWLSLNCAAPLSTSSIDLSSSVSVYPNPVEDQLFISLSQYSSMQVHVQLSDIRGAVLYKNKLNTDRHEISLKDLSPGIYLLTVRNALTNESFVHKVVKQ